MARGAPKRKRLYTRAHERTTVQTGSCQAVRPSGRLAVRPRVRLVVCTYRRRERRRIYAPLPKVARHPRNLASFGAPRNLRPGGSVNRANPWSCGLYAGAGGRFIGSKVAKISPKDVMVQNLASFGRSASKSPPDEPPDKHGRRSGYGTCGRCPVPPTAWKSRPDSHTSHRSHSPGGDEA